VVGSDRRGGSELRAGVETASTTIDAASRDDAE
jgi:hypothetical protein